jgi:hypothetical protein
MTLQLDVRVDGTQAGASMLRGIGRRGQNPQGAYALIAQDFPREMSAEFTSQGTHGGAAWAELSSDYLEAKRNQGLSPRILEATRALRDSLTTRPGTEVTPSGISMGTSVPYTRFVHYGTQTQPARPILPGDRAAARWAEWLTRDIAEGAP